MGPNFQSGRVKQTIPKMYSHPEETQLELVAPRAGKKDVEFRLESDTSSGKK